MDEAALEAAVRSSLSRALLATSDQAGLLSRLEAELPALMGQLYPGSDDDLILQIVRRCVAEARNRAATS